MKNIICFLILVAVSKSFAQNITAKVVDSQTGESIPYANIRINDSENLVSNGEGYFTITESHSDDSTVLTLSYLGYVNRQVTVGAVKNSQMKIALTPAVYEIDDVKVVKPDPNSIMAAVKKNLAQNYKSDGKPLKNKLFYREATAFKPSKFDLEITESTGFTKKNLKSVNSQLNAFTSKLIAQPPVEFTDMLCNYYTSTSKGEKNTIYATKLDVVKATKLKDENRSVALEDLEKTATKIFLQHLDSTKYYRVKSGWFGSQDTISLRKDFNKKKKNKPKNTAVTASKSHLHSFMTENSFFDKGQLDFVNATGLYEYFYEGAIFSNDELVYVLKFQPKKRKANYTGKLYVSQKDYAVVRADYTLAEGKTAGGFNMKLLLGVKTSENLSKGTLIFKQNPGQEGYYLQYASNEIGQYIYVNRPIKFIELTEKDDEDVVAFDLTLEVKTSNKTEFLNMAREEIAAADFEKVSEADFNYIRLKRYDPEVWKGYSAMEPLEEMKQYQVIE